MTNSRSQKTSDSQKSIRKKLERERARLIKELEDLEKPKDYGEEVEEDEEADEAEEFAADIAKGQALRQRISEIDAELEKLKNKR
jgi:RNA polymerase-binding transcription factor DksA